MSKITKLRLLLVVIIGIALGSGALWLLVPPPAGVDTHIYYSPLGAPVTLVDTVIAISGGLLLLRALRNFKAELRPAYRLITIAQLSVGAFTLLFPYIEYYGLWDNVWFVMSSYLSYFVGSMFMYMGARKFTQTSGMRSRATSLPLIIMVILALWGIHALIPRGDVWHPFFGTLQYNLFEVVVIIPAVCYGASAYLFFKVMRFAGKDYRKSLGWLGAGLSLQLFSALTIVLFDIIGYNYWYATSRAYEIPTILGDAGVLMAAYCFNAMGLAYKQGGWKRMFGQAPEPVTSPTIIGYVAGLASDISKVDPSLDKMRALTALHDAGRPFTPEEQRTLRDVYLEIENYLLTADPLRQFTKGALREQVKTNLGADANMNDTFWPSLDKNGGQPAQ